MAHAPVILTSAHRCDRDTMDLFCSVMCFWCTTFCSVSISVKPDYKVRELSRTRSSHYDNVRLSHSCDSQPSRVQRSDNQLRLFVQCCWVHQRRSHSVPWVLTPCLPQLPLIRAFTLPYYFIHIHRLSYYYFVQSFSVIHTQHTDAQCLIVCASKTYPTMQLPSKNWSCNISQSIAMGYVLLFSTEQTPTTRCSVHLHCNSHQLIQWWGFIVLNFMWDISWDSEKAWLPLFSLSKVTCWLVSSLRMHIHSSHYPALCKFVSVCPCRGGGCWMTGIIRPELIVHSWPFQASFFKHAGPTKFYTKKDPNYTSLFCSLTEESHKWPIVFVNFWGQQFFSTCILTWATKSETLCISSKSGQLSKLSMTHCL